MQQFIEKFQEQISGVLSGFDRLVFRGSLRRLNAGRWDPRLQAVVATGMEEYLWQNHIWFKDYAAHVKTVSERLKKASLEPFRQQGLPILFLRSPAADKDQLARRLAAERNIDRGLVCALSALEPSPTFEHRGTCMIRRQRPCHVLYHYQIHPQVGWCYARIQTWFPFNIQIGINGREWLARQMDQEGVQYRKQGNCFVWIEDYQRAQQLLDQQLQSNWAELLGSFGQRLNPLREQIFTHYPTDYYWTVFQSEWATDVGFRDAAYLKRLMSILVPHGMFSFSSSDVLRYFGQRVNQSGAIPARFNREVKTDLKHYREGERVKYTLAGNSAKFYDKAYSEWGNILRAAETTINNVDVFKEYRAAEGGPKEDLRWRKLRRGIAGLHRRAEISQHTNARMLNALASVDDSRRVEELTAEIQKPTRWKGRRVRALRPWGDDQPLLAAINHGDFLIPGLRNRDLQKLLYNTEAESPTERRRRSAAVSRKLRLLRAHGVIQKVGRTHTYQIQESARATLVAILITARTSVRQLNQLGKAA
jgi:hypothetical protein